MKTPRKPSKTTSKAGKRLRLGDPVAALALEERGQLKRLKKRPSVKCPTKRPSARSRRRS